MRALEPAARGAGVRLCPECTLRSGPDCKPRRQLSPTRPRSRTDGSGRRHRPEYRRTGDSPQPARPGIGRIDRIPVPPLPVDYVVRGPISTREVLSDEKVMKASQSVWRGCLKRTLEEADIYRISCGSPRHFTVQSGLASDWALDAIEAVEAAGGMASMIMLGDAVFAFGGTEALQSFGEVHTTTISQRGANLD